MTKPGEIDQDAWEKAKVGVRSMTSRPMSEIDVASTIARAIMSARAEEREACVRIVLDYPPEGFNEALYERTERYDEHDPFWKFEGDTGNWAALMGEVLKPYAAAIRNRP